MKPMFYVRGTDLHSNYYTENPHPNDWKGKQNSEYKKGNSKGVMLGLEEAGWMPCETLEEALEVITLNFEEYKAESI